MTDTRTRGSLGMGGHSLPNDGETVEWYTPPGIFDALGLTFDLDPASPPGGLSWVPARRFYGGQEDGLILPWEGRVWLNPPYGRQTVTWLRRLAAHGDGVALVFARTETEWFHDVIPTADVVCFIQGRLTFVRGDGLPATSNAGAPSMLIAWGDDSAQAVVRSGLGLVFGVRSRPLEGQATIW